MKTVNCAFLVFLMAPGAALAAVSVTSPAPGSTVTSPVHYVATATAPSCAAGVASMGIYVNNVKVYVVNGAKLDLQLTLSAGAQHTVVEEWDKCKGASFQALNLTVTGSQTATTVAIGANPTSITSGNSSTLTVTATNATAVTVSGTDSSSYSLATTGGTVTVTPASTTTYTAQATGTNGPVSSAVTVNVGTSGGGGGGSASAVNHVIMMLQENHTFDNYFGLLNPYRVANHWNVGDDGNTYTIDGIDDKLSKSNLDDEGVAIPLFKQKSTCIDDDSSDFLASYGSVNRYDFSASRAIKMDGFVHTAEGFAKNCASTGACSGNFTDLHGQRAMGYYDQDFLNYYYYMASQFAIANRWFSPLSSKSVPNRIATFTGGTTQGLVLDPGGNDHLPQLAISTIFNELDKANVSWKIYYTVTQGFCTSDDECPTTGMSRYPATTFSNLTYSFNYLRTNPSKTSSGCTGILKPSSVVGDSTNSFCVDPDHIAPLSQYYSDLTDGTLPQFSFIEAGYANNDEHPGSGQSILNGQAQVAKVINAFMTSSSWSDSVFFLSYDEGGGPYDHVPPVPGHSNDFTSASLKGSIPDISTIAVNADSYKPCLPPPGSKPTTHCDLNSDYPGAKSTDAPTVRGLAAQLGFRTPNMIVSPFTRRHYVGNAPMDHTAILKFVETRFIGGSTHLTPRVTAQPNLLDFFDFTGAPWATPPSPPAPVTASSLGHNPCTPASMQ